MGNFLNTVMRFLCSKSEDEEGERGQVHPYPVLSRRNNGDHYSSSSSSFERLCKILSIHKLLYNVAKKLFQKLRNIFQRKPAEPTLPVKIAAPKVSSNCPVLGNALLISSPGDDLNAHEDGFQNDDSIVVPQIDDVIILTHDFTPSSLAHASAIEEKTEYAAPRIITSNDPLLVQTLPISSPDEGFPSHQQWSPEENYSPDTIMQQMDDVIICICPDFIDPLAHASASEEITESAVFIEPQNCVPDRRLTISDKKDEKKKKKKRRKKRKEENKDSSVSHVVVDEVRIKWIKHYSSSHRILIVGDGDFSFSSSLARAFECASNMISTSLDSKEFLEKNYHKFMSNIKELKSRGCKVMHGIDATKMASHELLGNLTYDRIIYNFPFAGFFKNLSRKAELRRHRRLVSLFLKNAKEMISEDGEIHISHKTNGFHAEWNLESLASSHGLRLIEAVDFKHLDYPGYNTKCGFGGDNNFICYPSKTYKFGLKTA